MEVTLTGRVVCKNRSCWTKENKSVNSLAASLAGLVILYMQNCNKIKKVIVMLLLHNAYSACMNCMNS